MIYKAPNIIKLSFFFQDSGVNLLAVSVAHEEQQRGPTIYPDVTLERVDSV